MSASSAAFGTAETPIGTLYMICRDGALCSLGVLPPSEDLPCREDLPIFLQTRKWLDGYFAGDDPDPSVIPLSVSGTAFRKRIWETIRRIPYGHSVSYSALAEMAGVPRAVRAVGNAAGKNPVLLLIPCHRVTAKHGPGGFSAQLWRKRYLLSHENISIPEKETAR